MKIVTVNVPEPYLEAVEKLVGEGGLFPSRSELIRVAVRNYLLRELKLAERLIKIRNPKSIKLEKEKQNKPKEKKYVRIPVRKNKEEKTDNPIQEIKMFEVLRRLDDYE